MKTPWLLGMLAVILAGSACSESPPPVDVYSVAGYVHAGPICPTVQNPPDPACEDRAVDGAVLAVYDADGDFVMDVESNADGSFAFELPAGTYTLVPQPVEGLMGTAGEQTFTVLATGTADLDVAYDTGIR